MALADAHGQMNQRYSVSTLLESPARGIGAARDERRLPTDMEPLDRLLGGGFGRNDLVLLGGHPGVGKTIAALQWARAMARSGAKVVVASFEHDQRTLLGRLIALEVGMLEVGSDTTTMDALMRGIIDGRIGSGSDVGRHPLVRAALAQVETYAGNLVLLPWNG